MSATLRISNYLIGASALSNIVNNSSNSSFTSRLFSTQYSTTRLRVYKGIPPSRSEIKNLNGVGFTARRASDLLIMFNYSGLAGSIGNRDTTITTAKSLTTRATAAGEATWFMLSNSSDSDPESIYRAIVGSVSNATGNGDLKFKDPNLVLGRDYYIQPLAFEISTQYDY